MYPRINSETSLALVLFTTCTYVWCNYLPAIPQCLIIPSICCHWASACLQLRIHPQCVFTTSSVWCGEGKSSKSLLNLFINVSAVGYAFIYFEDERDAEDAIRRLDNVSFGYNRRRLSVEWSRVISCLYPTVIFLHFHFFMTNINEFANHHRSFLCFNSSKLNQCQGAVIGLLGM